MFGAWKSLLAFSWKSLLIFSMLVFLSGPPWAASKTYFYSGAHQDDWPLFMNPSAYYDVRRPDAKVVFIYTTAGDAGHGTGTISRSQAYYLAREEGARRAVRFMATTRFSGTETSSIVTVNGHQMTRYVYCNAISYFLRLPDGNKDGAGFSGTGHQSLARLATGAIQHMHSITGMTTYDGWSDLTATLQQIILTEAQGSREVWINVPDPDERFNPGDHSDHLYTGRAMLDATENLPCVNKALFVQYATKNKPMNLTPADLIIDAAVWGVTVSGITDSSHKTTWDSIHNVWLGRNDFRIEPGVGECNF